MTEDDADIVIGMADAIERRRIELGLTPGAFADAAGLTRQGLNPVRQGRRKRYQDKVKIGVARALQWRPDAIDRLLNGDEPIPADQPAGPLGYDELVAEVTMLRDEVGRLRGSLGLPTPEPPRAPSEPRRESPGLRQSPRGPQRF